MKNKSPVHFSTLHTNVSSEASCALPAVMAHVSLVSALVTASKPEFDTSPVLAGTCAIQVTCQANEPASNGNLL